MINLIRMAAAFLRRAFLDAPQPLVSEPAEARGRRATERLLGYSTRKAVEQVFDRAGQNSDFDANVEKALRRIAEAQRASVRSIDAVSKASKD